jgi:hypothetical protein
MTTKLCTGPCGRELPLSAFHRDPTKRSGRMSRCRECRGAADRERRRAVSRERVAAALAEANPAARRRRAHVAAELAPPPDPDAPARAARIVALADEALERLRSA